MSNLTEIKNNILKQLNIVEVIGRYVHLTKKGKDYLGLCPFHDDKNLGSFHVSEEKQIFSCFSCGTGGDAIKFIQEIEHLTIIPALKKACEMFNIKEPNLNSFIKKINPKDEILINCLNEINNFYQVSLTQNSEGILAKEYLYKRGLTDEIIEFFNIGYSQNNGDNIIKYLNAKNFTLNNIDETGIINIKENQLKDVNSGRITFAIKNHDGNVVAFGARIFGDNKSNAKYINTRETYLFNKSKIFYNFSNAISDALKEKNIYIFEGYMDVIAAFRAGIRNAIGLMGTSLTNERLLILKKLNIQVRLCLDLDDPGQINSVKIIEQLQKYGINFCLVNNNTDFDKNIFKDSDAIINKFGSDYLKKFLNNLVSPGEWYLNFLLQRIDISNNFENRKKLVNYFIKFISKFNNPLDIEFYLKKVASITDFSLESITDIYKKTAKNNVFINNQQKENNAPVFTKKPSNVPQNQKIFNLNDANIQELMIFKYILHKQDNYYHFKNSLGFFTEKEFQNILNYLDRFVEQSAYEYSLDNFKDYLKQTSDISEENLNLYLNILNIINNYLVDLNNNKNFIFLVNKVIEKRNKRNKKIGIKKKLDSSKTDGEMALILDKEINLEKSK